jgi:pyruvate dehydrogenase E2 component (dihydrolipoamide acetyltransferase)
VIARKLLESKQTIPHYYLSIDCEMDALMSTRAQINASGDGAYKISVNDFVIKASALALRDVPELNASWMDTFIRQYDNVDINVAVQTESGLLTPVVANVDTLGLQGISANVKELAGKAKASKLTPADLNVGSFTISNLGMFGIKHFCAIINPPQAAILAVGTTEKRVVPASGDDPNDLKVVQVMNVTLSCDHRVVDGAMGAMWLNAFKGYMENPLKMLL